MLINKFQNLELATPGLTFCFSIFHKISFSPSWKIFEFWLYFSLPYFSIVRYVFSPYTVVLIFHYSALFIGFFTTFTLRWTSNPIVLIQVTRNSTVEKNRKPIKIIGNSKPWGYWRYNIKTLSAELAQTTKVLKWDATQGPGHWRF